jgi:hypothetical protein
MVCPFFQMAGFDKLNFCSTERPNDHYQRKAQTTTVNAESKFIHINAEPKFITINAPGEWQEAPCIPGILQFRKQKSFQICQTRPFFKKRMDPPPSKMLPFAGHEFSHQRDNIP